MALADLKPRPGWLGPCLPMEAPLCRTQQTIKYEPAPINCGSKPESPKVGRMSSGTGRERIAGGEASGSRQRTSANYTARIALKLVDLRKHLTLKKVRCHSLTRFLHLAFWHLGSLFIGRVGARLLLIGRTHARRYCTSRIPSSVSSRSLRPVCSPVAPVLSRAKSQSCPLAKAVE